MIPLLHFFRGICLHFEEILHERCSVLDASSGIRIPQVTIEFNALLVSTTLLPHADVPEGDFVFNLSSHNILFISHSLMFEDCLPHLIDRPTMNPSMTRPSKKINKNEWMSMYNKLQAYKLKNGTCNVPKRYLSDPKLGHWVRNLWIQYLTFQELLLI